MDSRIREALQGLYGAVSDPDVHIPDRLYGSVTEAASALLTAAPAPCEDKRKRDDAEIVSEYLKTTRDWYEQGHAEIGDEMSGIESEGDFAEAALSRLIDAARREQDAREYERLKDATIVDEFLKTYYPEQRRRFGITLCAAILQGTEPDRVEKSWSCRSVKCSDPPQDCDWPFCGCDPYADKVMEALIESGWTRPMVDPAKVSEDVERDILTIDRCIRYPDHFPGIAIKASAALDRLVLRIKEGNRG